MRAANAGKLVVVIDDDALRVVAAESYSEAMDRLSKLGRRADLIVCGSITEPC